MPLLVKLKPKHLTKKYRFNIIRQLKQLVDLNKRSVLLEHLRLDMEDAFFEK